METHYYHEYARIEDEHWWFQGRRAIVKSILRRWLSPDPSRRILDVGCGTGAMLNLLSEYGYVEGLETAPEAVSYCHQRMGNSILIHQGALPDELPSNEPYHVVTAFDVIEHIPNAVEALHAIQTVLVPGGILICTVPAHQFLWGPHDEINQHCRRYNCALLKRHLETAGYRVEWMSYFNTFLFAPIAGVRLFRKILPQQQTSRSDFSVPPHPLNILLARFMAAETYLLRCCNLPFGVSLAAVAIAPN